MQTRVRTWPSIGAAVALLVGAGLLAAAATASAADQWTMSASDIRALQQRLTDAHCYSGPIDGTANPATEAAVKACPALAPNVSGQLPPVVKILSPREGALMREREVSIEYELRSQSGLPIDTVEVLIDGRPTRGLARPDAIVSGTQRARQTVSLPPRDVEVGLIARSGSLTSEVATVRLKWAGVVSAPSAEDARRPKLYALVIGNAQYLWGPALTNPSNDARAIARLLRDLGFEVTLALDLGKASFEQQVRDFANSLDGATAAVFYYAGHGLQVDGRNYMVPVDAKMTDEADVPFELVSLDIVLQRLAHNRIPNIIFLDACRNDPLGEKLAKSLGARSNAVGQGLASVYASVGTLISFATQPGNFALDGEGKNSPFTKALLRHIPTPNVDVLSTMKQVRRDVVEQTRQAQVPWDTSSLVDEFFFREAKEETGKPDGLPPDPDRPVLSGRPPVQACDSVAASASDPERVLPGMSIGQINGPEGVKACRAALAKYPNTPRFEFQLARSLQKAENYTEAAALYRSLVERGYLAALTNYGWLLMNGQGVQKAEAAAVKLYVLAAHQGDLFGMFNVAMAYDSGQGLPYNPVQAAHWIYAALRLGHEYSIKQMSGDAAGWTLEFRIELQRLLRRASIYGGPLNGVFGPELWRGVRMVQTLPNAPKPGGDVPTQRFDPTSIPVNAPPPSRR